MPFPLHPFLPSFLLPLLFVLLLFLFFHPWWLTNNRAMSRFLCFINCIGTIYLTLFYCFFLVHVGWVIVGVWVHRARWFHDTSISCMSTMRSRMLARSSSARYGEPLPSSLLWSNEGLVVLCVVVFVFAPSSGVQMPSLRSFVLTQSFSASCSLFIWNLFSVRSWKGQLSRRSTKTLVSTWMTEDPP